MQCILYYSVYCPSFSAVAACMLQSKNELLDYLIGHYIVYEKDMEATVRVC